MAGFVRCLAVGVVLLLLFKSAVFANEDFSVKAVTEGDSTNSGSYYRFPLLQGGDAGVAAGINRQLAEDVLDIIPGEEKESLFENVRAKDNGMPPPLASVNYNIGRLDERLYSVTIEAEGCGAYCEYWEQSFNYDLSTGELINPDVLFTEEGLQSVLEFVEKDVRGLLQGELERLAALTAEERAAEFESHESYELAREMYQDCLSGATFRSLTGMDVAVRGETLRLAVPRCSNHALRALDVFGEFIFEMKLFDWDGNLSEYGRQILAASN